MGAKSSVEAAKLNADNWGHLEVCIRPYPAIFSSAPFFSSFLAKSSTKLAAAGCGSAALLLFNISSLLI